MQDAGDATAITARCPQCGQVVRFAQDPARLGPSGRDHSRHWVCPNPSCGYVADYREIDERRVDD